MDFKDYYAIMGVAADADEATIKKTYRKLARKYHPDVNQGNKESEEKFKEINEAYQVLSHADQRKKYDELRAQYQQWQQRGGQPNDFNFQDWQAQPDERVHVQYGTMDDLNDLFGEDSAYSDFFRSIFGEAVPERGRARTPRKGQDVEAEVEISLEEAAQGATRLLQLDERRIEARIPAGVRTGSRVRLSGQGQPGRTGGPAGDLYLVVRVLPHAGFEQQGDDLYADVDVDIYTAVLGGEVRVPTLERAVLLKIPAQTQAGRSFRLRGKGLPQLGHPESRGDLFARVRLVLPEKMSEEEVNAIKEAAAKRSRETA
jgi:curved DNA-binding protein